MSQKTDFIDTRLYAMTFTVYGAFWGYCWTANPNSEACSFRTAGKFVFFQRSKIFLTSRNLFWAIESVGVQ